MTRNANECIYYKGKLARMKERYNTQKFADKSLEMQWMEKIDELQTIVNVIESRLENYERMQVYGYLS